MPTRPSASVTKAQSGYPARTVWPGAAFDRRSRLPRKLTFTVRTPLKDDRGERLTLLRKVHFDPTRTLCDESVLVRVCNRTFTTPEQILRRLGRTQ
jgi:hypothetical protein